MTQIEVYMRNFNDRMNIIEKESQEMIRKVLEEDKETAKNETLKIQTQVKMDRNYSKRLQAEKFLVWDSLCQLFSCFNCVNSMDDS